MEKIKNKYYKSEWVGLTKDEAYGVAKNYENELGDLLLDSCGFIYLIYTRDNIIAKKKASSMGIILPDIYGSHKNGNTYWIEAKRKNRRLKYNDTGLDVYLIDNYLKAQREFSARVVILFKDNPTELPKESKSWYRDNWYGGFLDKLHKETSTNPINTFSDPKKPGNMIKCFPLSKMLKAEDIWKSHQTHFKLDEWDKK